MSEKKILYVKGETKDFDTEHKNIRVKIEVLNEDIARVFLVDKNDIPIDDLKNVVFMNVATKNEITTVLVENRKSYLITWINSYELSVDEEHTVEGVRLQLVFRDAGGSGFTENAVSDENIVTNFIETLLLLRNILITNVSLLCHGSISLSKRLMEESTTVSTPRD
ncbi:14793_t:CDS:2 [Entrophospora sp. SA101]|nr:14793_t:CDS:2 [Entrophospora sp. SA101]